LGGIFKGGVKLPVQPGKAIEMGSPLWLCFVREIMGNHGKSWEIICITLDETIIDYDSF
jgi:hypothetical protein